VNQIPVPVPVEVHGMFVIGLRLELKLTDLAMRRTAHLPRREIAAVDHLQCVHQLFPELVGTAASDWMLGKLPITLPKSVSSPQ